MFHRGGRQFYSWNGSCASDILARLQVFAYLAADDPDHGRTPPSSPPPNLLTRGFLELATDENGPIPPLLVATVASVNRHVGGQ